MHAIVCSTAGTCTAREPNARYRLTQRGTKRFLCHTALAGVRTEDREHGSAMHRANLQKYTALPRSPISL
jgi:hypothetical protein